ncbi:unnamed protein product [Fraxinus pennsylvanica]|uniref:LysM domain receptor-like kinase 3 n=1 Tax=Fraxinus pennsylvanica TaxID=56036 RepID=A0AAD1YZP3_9LAMI|nr:unnamed protein product [Fraxinus pennsylvanica]
MDHIGEQILIIFSVFLLIFSSSAANPTTPLNCTDTTRLCTSFIAFKPTAEQTLAVIQSMFDVLPQDIRIEGNGRNYIFIKKNCSCSSDLNEYLTSTTFTVRENNGSVYDMVMRAYDGLAYFSSNVTREARNGAVVSLKLMCGCSSGLWNYLMSYVMRDGDSIESLASRFGVSMDSIVTVNGIANPDNVTIGALYYIPLNSVPGEPYPLKNDTSPAPVPARSIDNFVVNHKPRVHYWWIIGSLVIGRYICCKSGELKQRNGESSNRQMNIPSVIGTDVFDVEKPVVFTYEEVLSSTDDFSDSNLLGNGTYGSVYYGLLRDQEVVIKRMKATKTKEFIAEMKVLCKVHHTNLVELIGYAASDDELFLIYEYAQKGSLRNHLHDPQNKGHTSLSWIMRVQIALDAAKGLEYIHEHTKPHYVHRDIKSSNILLDASFKAKISDFGLTKLVSRTNDGEASVTRVVGTYGYLAPEYLRDGLATNKSDVYAFGVVLFEIISGKEAMIKSTERRSLASIVVAALRNSPDSMSMSSLNDHIDPNLMDLYPHDCLYKLAMLAKQCVDDDPILRPDMKQVVISLSQILLSSIEWEATLAGNSQVFSGLVQGR